MPAVGIRFPLYLENRKGIMAQKEVKLWGDMVTDEGEKSGLVFAGDVPDHAYAGRMHAGCH